MTTPLIRRDRNAIAGWLAICALLVAMMVLIGGYTRLSGSGLSITEWKPVYGTLPPMNDAQWLEEFAAYRHSPQYIKVNSAMTLEDFKGIFWPEYIHRLVGRLTGVVLLVPLLAFCCHKSLTKRFGWRLGGIFALGGVQGGIGWFMVKSGLIDNPQVSHVRLALHLGTAFTLYALLLWTLFDVLQPYSMQGGPERVLRCPRGDRARRWYGLWFAALCVQVVLGAFVAGLHAGLIYNTWPDMNGEFMPYDDMLAGPWYANLALIQFAHRTLATIVALGFLFWWYSHWRYVKNAHLGKVCAGLVAFIAVQFALGVATLLYQVPLPLALAHQTTALLLFTLSVALLHALASKRTIRLT